MFYGLIKYKLLMYNILRLSMLHLKVITKLSLTIDEYIGQGSLNFFIHSHKKYHP